MRVSAGLPTGMEGLTYPIPFSDPEALIQIAKHAERLGYHSVWGNDHMTTQQYVRAEFPTPPRFWEPLITYGNNVLQDKLIFGTSWPLLPLKRSIEEVRSLPMKPEVIEKWLGGNLARIIGEDRLNARRGA